jgi:hypothetical protein
MNIRLHLLSATAFAVLAVLAVGSVDEKEVEDAIDEAKREAEAHEASRGSRPPARPASPPASTPRERDADAALQQLFSDSLSIDQRDDLFARAYENRPITVAGRITDVGTWFGEKYLTVEVADDHRVDVFPAEDFDLLDYRVGGTVRFEGEFTRLGTGLMIHHRVDKAREVGR